MITSWRIARNERADGAFDGEGARLHGGRWNLRGTPVVYTSQTASLAALEILVHMGADENLQSYVIFACHFAESLVEPLDRGTLPADWRTSPPPPALQQIGDRWVREARSAVLEVPSAIIETESNYLLNPAHGDFSKLPIADRLPFTLDVRLLR